MGGTATRWFRKPILVRDSRFDSCILRQLQLNIANVSCKIVVQSRSGKKMKNNKNQQILIGGAIVFRENRGKRQYLLVRQKDNEIWEIPKVTVKRGESSVRAVLRLTSEQGGMAARVLEEAGRTTGTTVVNGKSIPQKFYYYLILQKGGNGDLIGFDEFKWTEYSETLKKLGLKKEKDLLKDSRDVLKEWEKTHNLKKQEVVMF